ncbi:MAG: aminotransferase class V-fold PLP-dependent enzyme [Paracoccaceae bacterium]|nr:aminotransferase class V-fold PLP-dependent enzyme [Paracoccaceae bacterium]
MSLSNGREYLAIPGPSVMPDAVLRAMHRAAPNIYTGQLWEMVPGIVRDLKAVARTEHQVAMYIGNGHAAWEAALANVLSRGDKVLTLATGRFGKGWGECAARLGAEVEVLDFGLRAPTDPARLAERLAADPDHAIKAVLFTHVDTATSALSDTAAIRAALDAAGHPALLMVDCIASLACDRFEMDAWGADVTVAGCQKGLMTPPGMAFVYFNTRADAARDRADCVTGYWDWRPRVDAAEMYLYFFGTAPTHHLYGLRAALDMIAEEGLEAIWARHDALARAIWAAIEAWGAAGPLEFNIEDEGARSRAVTTLRIPKPHAQKIRGWVEDHTGLTLGLGIGMEEPGSPSAMGYFRIGHMGHLNAQMVLGALGSVEAALTGLGIPHGRGALDAAAEAIAGAAG